MCQRSVKKEKQYRAKKAFLPPVYPICETCVLPERRFSICDLSHSGGHDQPPSTGKAS